MRCSDGEALFIRHLQCIEQGMESDGSIIHVISIIGLHGTLWAKQNYSVSHLSSTLYITAPTSSTLQVSPKLKS